MKLFTKDEANTHFGSMNVWNRSNMLANKMGYIAGIKVFDELNLLRSPKTGASFNLEVREKGIVFSVLKGFSFRFTGIPLGAARYLVIEPQAQIIEKKEKSVVGRAVVGGLLLGPLGAIVGGISGVGTKDVIVKTDIPDNLVTFGFTNEDGSEGQILLSLSNKEVTEVRRFFDKQLPSIIKEAEAVVDVLVNPPSTPSLADEIIKLRKLLDDGVLTQAEFDDAKKKLLQ